MNKIILKSIIINANEIIKSISDLIFIQCKICGALLLLAITVINPAVSVFGFICAALASYCADKVGASSPANKHIFSINGLLLGMYIGAIAGFSLHAIVFLCLALVLVIIMTTILLNMITDSLRLPVLSLPYIVSGTFISIINHGLSDYVILIPLSHHVIDIFPEYLVGFLSSLGAIFFIPNPFLGLLIIALFFVIDSFIFILALIGYAVFLGVISQLNIPAYSYYNWLGFTSILTSISLGAVFLKRGYSSLITAIIGTVFTTLLSASMSPYLLAGGFPTLSLPFVLVLITILFFLQKRNKIQSPFLALDNSIIKNIDRATGKYDIDIRSTPVLLPVIGQWDVYQDINGEFTHQKPWQFALDFYITENGNSFKNNGDWLTDYFCFGKPVVSPVYGTIIAVVNDIKDNLPLSVNLHNPWGNHVIIAINNGLYLVLAHLQQYSINVNLGTVVKLGDTLAACGSSGRSPEPHLHMHVQVAPWIGPNSYTLPFYLLSVLTKKNQGELFYKHTYLPKKDERIQTASYGRVLKLSVGSRFKYTTYDSYNTKEIRELYVKLLPDNQFLLCSDKGAFATFTNHEHALLINNRSGAKDTFFDIWILAHSLTPQMEVSLIWQDSPPINWFPNNIIIKFLISLTHPFGTTLKSNFKRNNIIGTNSWMQTAEHKAKIFPGVNLSCETISEINHNGECVSLDYSISGLKHRAQLHTVDTTSIPLTFL